MAKYKSHLRVVADNGSRVADPIFFRKEDVRKGTRLFYHGASGHGEWVVNVITTTIRQDGQLHDIEVDDVRVLSDVLTITRVRGGRPETRRVSFSYLRYSAIWRLTR